MGKMVVLGSHVSCQGGFAKAVGRAMEIGCECIQIFVSNPPRQWPVVPLKPQLVEQGKQIPLTADGDGQWAAKPIVDDVVTAWKSALSESPLTHPIAHASYLINLASPDEQLFRKSIDALVVELERSNLLQLEGLVLHPGAFTKSSEDEGIDRVIDGVCEAFQRVPPGSCRLLLENTAGQGTCLGHTIEHLARMLDGIGADERVGVCFDTCHAFAAGYEINDAEGFSEMRQEMDDLLPAGAVAALHLNDSKKPLGSRVDRHEHIGRGEIGLDGFRHVFADPVLGELPGYLETEKGIDEETEEDWDVINLRTLRSLI